MQHDPTQVSSKLFRLTSAVDEFDGACDPVFDDDLEELERQFAVLRLAQSLDLN